MKQHVFPNKAEAGDVDVEDSNEICDEDDGVFDICSEYETTCFLLTKWV